MRVTVNHMVSAVALVVLASSPGLAQIAAHNAAGVAAAHEHFRAMDVGALKQFWIALGGVTVGVTALIVVAVSAGANSLGLEDLSVSSIEQELQATTDQTQQGGSQFDPGGNSLNPLGYPERAVNVLMRPWPWEVESGFQLLALIGYQVRRLLRR